MTCHRFYSNTRPIPITLKSKSKGCDDMLKKHLLFRCHGEDAQDHAQLACEFVKGYFDLWNKRVKMTCEAYEYPGREENSAPIPYDVFIETANQHTADIAHAAGWSYLTARDVNARIENLKKNGGETE